LWNGNSIAPDLLALAKIESVGPGRAPHGMTNMDDGSLQPGIL
jgi:hypothetical protein